MDHERAARRTFLALAAATPLAVGLASCGSSGPGQAAEQDAAIWILTGPPGEQIRTAAVEAFNEEREDGQVVLTTFQSDAYKAKIRTAIGAGQGPTIIWTWGGGGLRDYVQNGEVEDLTDFFDQNPELRERRFASSFGAATVDDKVYAVPCEQVAPVVLFYNRTMFEQAGVQPPTTWDELMALVPVFTEAGVAPFAMAGQSRWTSMMWLEYLFDRIGGPAVFDAIYAGEPGAWSVPAVLDALTKAQDLVRAGGFITGFETVSAEADADLALIYTGRAAMILHGAWAYGGIKDAGGDFVPGGELGFVTFPVVEGGLGDPANAVGNPASYFALSSRATEEAKTLAKEFLADGLLTEDVEAAWVEAGAVPVVDGADAGFAGSPDEEWLQFVYDLASGAPNFQQSWDQALGPTQAEVLLNNIEQLFGLTITPAQFAAALDASLGT